MIAMLMKFKNSQPNNLKDISPWQDLLMKDEPIVSSYIADSYQKLFEEIKKKRAKVPY